MDLEKALIEHYQTAWGNISHSLVWSKGPQKDLPKEFRVLSFSKDSTTSVLATCGLSFGSAENKIELFLYCPENILEENRLCEILTVTAHYHLTGGNLGVGHSVNWGEPIINGSLCNWGYLSWPYLEGESFGDVQLSSTKILWLVPITKQELEYKKKNGVDALEIVFEEQGLNYISFFRQSMV